jgi:hypothetical protein
VSNSAKWVIAIVLAVVGVLALIVGIIYAAVPIHSLPGFLPGSHPGYGTYHKRGAVALVVGVILLAVAVVIGLSARRAAPVASSSVASGADLSAGAQ